MNERMNQILDELCKPFHPSLITWRPAAMTGDKMKAMAIAYAELRAYQNRLDEVCGMDWSVSYTPWSERIICHLTINGITRSSTGEPDSDAEREENAGRSAETQAFTRACAMFGLGRYLYNMPTLWVEYDAPNQRFTEKAKSRLHGMIAQHYQRFLDGQPAVELADDEQPEAEEKPTAAVATQATVPANQVPHGGLIKMDELGATLYGEQWPTVRTHNIKRLVGEGKDESALTTAQIQTLINGLKKLQQQRTSR